MSQGWMRVREAAHLMGVSQTTVRRRMDTQELRSRVGRSGRQEVFLPVKLRRELEAKQARPCPPGHLDRGKTVEDEPVAEALSRSATATPQDADRASSDRESAAATCEAAGTAVDESHTTDAEQAAQVEQAVSPGIDLVRRYEKLAGGSLILAQKHSDEMQKHNATAFEQLAHTRSQLRLVRKVALTGWASCAAAVVLGLFFSIMFGVGMSRAHGVADASQAYAKQAEAGVKEARRDAAAAQSAAARAISLAEPMRKPETAAAGTVAPPSRAAQDPRLLDRGSAGLTVSVPTE